MLTNVWRGEGRGESERQVERGKERGREREGRVTEVRERARETDRE